MASGQRLHVSPGFAECLIDVSVVFWRLGSSTGYIPAAFRSTQYEAVPYPSNGFHGNARAVGKLVHG